MPKVALFIVLFITVVNGLSVTVKTTKGVIKGLELKDTLSWRGVPFAAPPVGQNRWRDPQPVQPWNDTLSTVEHGPGCPQWCLLPPRFCPNVTNESCLFLNVWSPKNATSASVMFFLAGGGFAMGDSSSELYDGERLAEQTGNVIVTANYRLGPLGYLVRGKINGNFGIRDQHAALTWVQDNIAFFGGNASQVTIFGESAGGMSIGVHMVSPYSKGLFHRAIIQSNPLATPYKTRTVAEAWGIEFSTVLGCPMGKEECLRSKTAEQIVSASKWALPFPSHIGFNGSGLSLPWDPVIDGDLLPEQPLDAVDAGRFNHIPVIIGTTSEEGWLFVNMVYRIPMFSAVYTAAVIGAFGTNSLQVLRHYPPPLNPLADCRAEFARLITDAIFTCPSRRFAETLSKQTPTYVYEFNHVTKNSDWYMGQMTYCKEHVCHGAELVYVFGTMPKFTFSEQVLSDKMMSFWGNFARVGVPGDEWPEFHVDGDRRAIEFNTPNVIQDQYKNDPCDFWDTIGYDV